MKKSYMLIIKYKTISGLIDTIKEYHNNESSASAALFSIWNNKKLNVIEYSIKSEECNKYASVK